MTITELKEHRRNLSAQLAPMRQRAQALSAGANASLDDITKLLNEIQALSGRIDLADGEIADLEKQSKPTTPPAIGRVDAIKSNEYARAYANALRNGVSPRNACPSDEYRILYDVLTEGGGSPTGTDGGFLVPEDIDHSINEVKRQFDLFPMLEEETVSTNSGWRVKDVAPTTGFTALTGEGTQPVISDSALTYNVPRDDQPSFAKVSYSLTTYGLIIPLSNELVSDVSNDAGLFAYVSRFFGKKLAMTKNGIVKTKLETLSSSNIAVTDAKSTVNGIKDVLNVTLDPMISANAAIITNQDGFNYLDSLCDSNGRPLMQWDPTTKTPVMFGAKPIHVLPNRLFATRVVTTTGATKGSYYPIYAGDINEFMSYYKRAGLEMLTSNIAGSAFDSYTTNTRGIARLGASIFDTDAMARREIFIAAT